jgi:hypothetical protein
MKITIVQSEIETAIEDYLRQQITINDDQEIVIDLSATRGPEGFRAEIDIRKIAQAIEEAPLNITKAVRGPNKVKTPAIALPNTDSADMTKAEGTATAEEVQAKEADLPVAEAGQEAPAAEPQAEAEPAATMAKEAPIATAKPSLFGGLKKPSNKSAE